MQAIDNESWRTGDHARPHRHLFFHSTLVNPPVGHGPRADSIDSFTTMVHHTHLHDSLLNPYVLKQARCTIISRRLMQDIEMQMILLFALAALAAWASPAYAGSCGNTLMYNDFNKYPGGYQRYTKSMMQQDFPPGPNKITTSQGQQKFTGLVFLKFDYNAEVGQGVFRAKNPKGTPCT